MLYIKQLLHFTYEQALSCLFPVVIFLTLALSKIVSIPGLYRYDFILIACLLMQWIMYKTGLETKDELKVITVFHLIGLLLEIYKVHFGSWSYPEEAYSKILSSTLQRLYVRKCRKLHMPSVEKVAFKNASLAESYFCRAVRSYDLLQFFTHHFTYDFRWILTLLLFIVFSRTFVQFSLQGVTYTMPLVLSFSLSDSSFGLQRTSQHFSEHGNIQINGKRGISFT